MRIGGNVSQQRLYVYGTSPFEWVHLNTFGMKQKLGKIDREGGRCIPMDFAMFTKLMRTFIEDGVLSPAIATQVVADAKRRLHGHMQDETSYGTN